jgi:flotillin
MQNFLTTPLGVAAIIILALILIISCIFCAWKKVPSDKAAVIVGLGAPKVVHGGGKLVIPGFQRMDTITLENIQINVSISKTKTRLGVPINANGVLIVKVKAENESIQTAVQQFCNSSEKETRSAIQNIVMEVATGKLREIVSRMSVEELYDDREKFSTDVQKVVDTALGTMGLEIKSFTINDISDDDGYIASLGKEQIAKVKAQAAIAEAEAKKEEAIKTAQSTKEQQVKTAEAARAGREAQLLAETEIAKAEKDKQLKIEAYRKEAETTKAISDAAYQIQSNITSKDVKNTEMDAKIIEKQRLREVSEAEVQVRIAEENKNIELAKSQAERAKAELIAKVLEPAEAEKERRRLEAEARKYEEIAKAEAEAEKTRLSGEAHAKVAQLEGEANARVTQLEGEAQARVIEAMGQAEAEAIKSKGLAEAEALEKKAEALAKMNEAGKLQMVADILPELAKAVAEPFRSIDKITIIGGSSSSGDGISDVAGYVTSGLTAVSEALQETVGFDLKEVMRAKTFEGQTTKNVNISGLEDSILNKSTQ